MSLPVWFYILWLLKFLCQSPMFEFGLCPFTSSMLTCVLMEKLPKINVYKLLSIIFNSPSWVLITTSHDSMSLSERNLMTLRADNQVAGLGGSASDFIHKVLSLCISQDTGYPEWGFCGFPWFLQTNSRAVLWHRLQQLPPLLSHVISHYRLYHSTQ